MRATDLAIRHPMAASACRTISPRGCGNSPSSGMRVIIARGELNPTEFADPHLFVHKDLPPVAAATPAPAPHLHRR